MNRLMALLAMLFFGLLASTAPAQVSYTFVTIDYPKATSTGLVGISGNNIVAIYSNNSTYYASLIATSSLSLAFPVVLAQDFVRAFWAFLLPVGAFKKRFSAGATQHSKTAPS